jgi:DNA polymerase elongation subunit (family B)
MHNSESVFETLLIITKKRYIGKFAVEKMIHKGIVALRRDTCAFLKTSTLW